MKKACKIFIKCNNNFQENDKKSRLFNQSTSKNNS